jgi:hypothetical protein
VRMTARTPIERQPDHTLVSGLRQPVGHQGQSVRSQCERWVRRATRSAGRHVAVWCPTHHPNPGIPPARPGGDSRDVHHGLIVMVVTTARDSPPELKATSDPFRPLPPGPEQRQDGCSQTSQVQCPSWTSAHKPVCAQAPSLSSTDDGGGRNRGDPEGADSSGLRQSAGDDVLVQRAVLLNP